MKNFLTLLMLACSLTWLSSCDDDDDTVPVEAGDPVITAPTTAMNVYAGNNMTVTFDVNTPAGYKSANVTTSNGTVTITSEPEEEDTSGEVVVSYNAGNTSGAGVVTLTITDQEDDTDDATATVNVSNVLTGNITESITLSNDLIWEVNGRVFVTNGATLTIEQGSIIKGRSGIGTSASVLTIARGAKINAVGTADEPIIFTSIADDISLGEYNGTNLDQNDNQLWGGLVLLGNAPISPNSGEEAQIEGVPASEPLGLYGGNDPADNSGVLKFVSIRHGGTNIDASAGNDINGLTLGGVGTGTEISNIEVISNYDDGVEFFGGTVNVTDLLVYGVGDDAVDIDQAYAGTVDNFWVYTTSAAGSDKALEIDGPEGASNASGKFTLENGTIVSVNNGGGAGDFKSSAQGTLTNIMFTGFSGGGADIKLRANFDGANSCADKTDAYLNLINDDLVFTTVEFASLLVYSATSECDVPASYQDAAAAKMTSTSASGAGTANWDWTLSSQLELLAN